MGRWWLHSYSLRGSTLGITCFPSTKPPRWRMWPQQKKFLPLLHIGASMFSQNWVVCAVFRHCSLNFEKSSWKKNRQVDWPKLDPIVKKCPQSEKKGGSVPKNRKSPNQKNHQLQFPPNNWSKGNKSLQRTKKILCKLHFHRKIYKIEAWMLVT